MLLMFLRELTKLSSLRVNLVRNLSNSHVYDNIFTVKSLNFGNSYYALTIMIDHLNYILMILEHSCSVDSTKQVERLVQSQTQTGE